MTTIGSIISPTQTYDLEGSLRVHRLLVRRSLAPRWRFKDTSVTTGPFESLLGYPGCGSSSGGTSWCLMGLPVQDGRKALTTRLNRLMWKTLCRYPDLAALTETIPYQKHRSCVDELARLAAYEQCHTRQPLNHCWKRATLVKAVRLVCCESGVYLDANVTFRSKRDQSSWWGLYYLARQNRPHWNERLRLATWLARAERSLKTLVKPIEAENEREEA